MTFFGGLSAEHLKQFIERIERLEEEKKIKQKIKQNKIKQNIIAPAAPVKNHYFEIVLHYKHGTTSTLPLN